MKNIFVFTAVLSASLLNGQTQNIEDMSAELAKAGIVMQEALALCYKKCDEIKAKDSDCKAAKDFVGSAVQTCYEMCARRANWKARNIKEDVANRIIELAEEEYKNTHK